MSWAGQAHACPVKPLAVIHGNTDGTDTGCAGRGWARILGGLARDARHHPHPWHPCPSVLPIAVEAPAHETCSKGKPQSSKVET
ncbi:hypothetical protein MTBUT4_100014 [Magnetospirillum sp. UT-4]|nr:hypothetical protein MTBUT4_100014 [Magnetospirillum sp. UT-4]